MKKIYFTIFNKMHIIYIEKKTKDTKKGSTAVNFMDYIANFIVEKGSTAMTTEMHAESFIFYSKFVDTYNDKKRLKATLEGYLELEEFGFNFDYSCLNQQSQKILKIKIKRLIRNYKQYKQLFNILQDSSDYLISNNQLISLITCKGFFIRWEIADIKNTINSKHLVFPLDSVKKKLQSEIDKQVISEYKTEYLYVSWWGLGGEKDYQPEFMHVAYVKQVKHTKFWSLEEQFFLSKSPVSNCWFEVSQAWHDQIHHLYSFITTSQLVQSYSEYLEFCILGPLESSCWLWCDEREQSEQQVIIQKIKDAMKNLFIHSKNLEEIENFHCLIVNSFEVLKKKAENDYFYSIRFITVQNSLNVLEKASNVWKEHNLKSTAAALTFCFIELEIIKLELTRFNG